MTTWPSSRHSTASRPPSRSTATARAVRPRRCAATAAAQAPVPHAAVMPVPRSHTRRRRAFSPVGAAMPTLTRSGNSASRSITGPTAARSMASSSADATKNTACGLPTLTAAGARNAVAPAEGASKSSSRVSISRASGISRQPSRATPISTATVPSSAAQARSAPARVSIRSSSRPFSAASSDATQRAALPQISTSPPSAL